jgi:hypothetical protein
MIKIKKIKSKFINKEKVKKISLRAYSYYLEIYGCNITVIFGSKNLEKYNKLFDRGSCDAICVDYLKTHHGEIVLFFKDNPKMRSISHECVHACNMIFEHIGYQYTHEGDEINAYLTGHLVAIVLKAKKKYNKGSKNND